jgi:hypothetical protein
MAVASQRWAGRIVIGGLALELERVEEEVERVEEEVEGLVVWVTILRDTF